LASLQLVLEGNAKAMEELRTCSQDGCQNVLVQKEGFVRTHGEGYATQQAPDRRTQTHVGIDRRRDGAEEGVLYTQEVLNEETVVPEGGLVPTRFRARVVAAERDMGYLRDVLEAEGAELRVGTSISRGLGRCRVTGFDEPDGWAPVAERVRQFNEAWSKRSADAEEQSLIVLTLDTPALFVDSFLRSNTTPTGADLLQAAGSEEADHREALSRLKRVHEVARPYRLQAWNGMAGFPHGTDQGIQSGSVLVYAASELSKDLLAALRHIETAGIGLRRELGLGQVRVCDPIHTRVHEHTATPSSADRTETERTEAESAE
jgi:CRISPR-associated Csx10 family RAMP protein